MLILLFRGVGMGASNQTFTPSDVPMLPLTGAGR